MQRQEIQSLRNLGSFLWNNFGRTDSKLFFKFISDGSLKTLRAKGLPFCEKLGLELGTKKQKKKISIYSYKT